MAGKLSETVIKAAKPAEKRYKLFDMDGLYLEVATNGSKWWRLRSVYGKRRVMSLGIYPEVSLKNAREKHDELRKTIAAGVIR